MIRRLPTLVTTDAGTWAPPQATNYHDTPQR